MVFIKVQKTRAYFKRFQVKFKRRREGKTDYYQRRRLIALDKDRYNTKKYRLIVRISNKFVVCQLAYATITGDIVVCQANSKELERYGIKVGLSNYAAAYATGLLVARRHLNKLKIAERHIGCSNPKDVGKDITNIVEDGPRCFKAVLDIGLSRSTTGAKIFGAMKGALDGGLNIPHGTNRFYGNKKDPQEYSPEAHRQRIYGVHVANYMKLLKEKDEAAYKKQFSEYIKAGVEADQIEALYLKAHAQIRANPESLPKKVKPKVEKKTLTPRMEKKLARQKIAKRHNRVIKKKERILNKIKASA